MMRLADTWNATPPRTQDSLLLRRFLLGNAAFSTLTGALSLIDATALTTAFGISDPLLLPVMGVQLLAFAAFLVWLASRETLNTTLVWIVIALDLGWVIGTIILLPIVSDLLTATGLAAMALTAFVVALLACGQTIGVRRLSLT